MQKGESMDIHNECIGTTVNFDPRMDEIMWWGKHLAGLGLAPRQHGNLSFITNRNNFIITRSGVELCNINHDDLVEVVRRQSFDDVRTVFFRGQHAPSKEALVHDVIYHYKYSSGTRAIFHLHDEKIVQMGDQLGIAATATAPCSGTTESVRAVENFFLNLIKCENLETSYFILKDHGIMAMGKDIHEAGGKVLYYHEQALAVEEE